MAQAAVALDREAFSCAICLDLLKDPATLSCGHSYCMRCIHDHWDEEEEKQVGCPQCRHSFISRPVLVKNTMLAVLVEQLEKSGPPVDVSSVEQTHVCCDVCSGTRLTAVKSCLQCLASFCEKHLEPHYQSAALRKHQLVVPSDKLQEKICSEHNEVKKMFCTPTSSSCVWSAAWTSTGATRGVSRRRESRDAGKARGQTRQNPPNDS
ncbi:hypothetical protein NQD34_018315 [Periophthalmus magnuspinnatus]|nr:hypothetical protein NQD34_018315 [Periophthalmus magnuspinnatus]